MSKNLFYAVKVGRKIGVFKTWEEASVQVKSYSGAQHKSFRSFKEAQEYLSCVNNKNIFIPTLSEFKNKIMMLESKALQELQIELGGLLSVAMDQGKCSILLFKGHTVDAERYRSMCIHILSKYGYSCENVVIFNTPGTAFCKEVYFKVVDVTTMINNKT